MRLGETKQHFNTWPDTLLKGPIMIQGLGEGGEEKGHHRYLQGEA